MSVRLAPGLVVVLLLLAGCSAVSLDGGEPAAPTETLTPVPVETPAETRTQTATPAAAAPGVAANGSVDVRALLNAHEAYLDGRSYTWVLGYAADGRDNESLDREFTRRVVVTEERYLAEQFGPGSTVNQSLYADDTGGYLRAVTDNGTNYDVVAEPGDADEYAIGGNLIWRYLTGLNLSVDTVDRDGRTYYRLHSINEGAPVALRGFTSSVDGYQVTAYVTPEGLVQTLIVEYDRSQAGRYQHVSVRFDYSDIDATEVSRPDWTEQVTPTPAGTPAESSTATPTPTPTLTPGGNASATDSQSAIGYAVRRTGTDGSRDSPVAEDAPS